MSSWERNISKKTPENCFFLCLSYVWLGYRTEKIFFFFVYHKFGWDMQQKYVVYRNKQTDFVKMKVVNKYCRWVHASVRLVEYCSFVEIFSAGDIQKLFLIHYCSLLESTWVWAIPFRFSLKLNLIQISMKLSRNLLDDVGKRHSPLTPGSYKRSYILKQTCSFKYA